MREEIKLDTSAMDLIVSMSEGNPGAVTVIAQLLKDKDMGLIFLLNLDDMNIRGTQIWVGYKDYCKEDIDKFREAVKKRDPEMVAKINAEGLRGNHKDKAVVGGASYGDRQQL